MLDGIQKYVLPNTSIEVDVSYRLIEGIGVVFDCASINDENLDCDMLGVHIETTKPSDLVRTTKYISLKDWFQAKLENDLDHEEYRDFYEENKKREKSDYEEHNLYHVGGVL